MSQLSLDFAPANALTFYLGAHHADWLARARVPLFVSRRTLCRMTKLPRAAGPWALDSGGFSELTMHGGWHLSAPAYVAEVRRYVDEIGALAWAAPQDWMCEPDMLRKTGLTVAEHQRRTTANYLELRELAPELPIIPVLQGWTMGEYFDHIEAYTAAGVDLLKQPLVGVGTVCRRQNTIRTGALLACLRQEGLRLHGFGFKVQGLRASVAMLDSADSMAWSLSARKNRPMEGHNHKSCANCIEYAMTWRADVLASLEPRGS